MLPHVNMLKLIRANEFNWLLRFLWGSEVKTKNISVCENTLAGIWDSCRLPVILPWTNVGAYFSAKWRLLYLISFNSICRENAWILIICSEKRTVSLDSFPRANEERIMSKDKYPSIFSPQIDVTVFIILQISCSMPAVLRIGEYSRL